MAGLTGTGAAITAAAKAPPTGWKPGKLAEVRSRASRNQVAALIVEDRNGRVVEFGDVKRPLLLHSARKSILSLLFGTAVAAGEAKLTATLAELRIDDDTPLTATEKSASVRDLLMARSGVYIPAAAESPQMIAARPKRGSHAPGSFWYYNNWDFNALGEIYTRMTGKGVFDAFDGLLARPLGMQDFDVYLATQYMFDAERSRFPAYHLALSARDLARIGRMLLDGGRSDGRQIIAKSWINESTATYSRTTYPGPMSGYAYLWWTCAVPDEASPRSFTAAGAGGHYLTILPDEGVFIVLRVDTFDRSIRSPMANPGNYGMFIREILASRGS